MIGQQLDHYGVLTFIDGGIMRQPDKKAENTTDDNIGSSTSIDQSLAEIYAYREQIEKLSKLINTTPQQELVKDYGKIKKIESQMADVIEQLEAHSGNFSGKKFNKGAVLKHLDNARVELNTASTLAEDTDRQIQVLSYSHIPKCREHLKLAIGLMSSKRD